MSLGTESERGDPALRRSVLRSMPGRQLAFRDQPEGTRTRRVMFGEHAEDHRLEEVDPEA
jgi:hypothetical protein